MSQPSGISLAQLVSALQRKSIPLPFEMSTFLVLETCERVVHAPVNVDASSIWMSGEGEVSVVGAEPASSGEDACRALVVLLGDLLVRSAPGVPQMLLALVEQGPSDGEWSLPRLRDDLEASLVPLNRAATRRVLSRLLREVHREGGDRSAAAPDHGELDNELDALLGVEPDSEPLPPPPAPAELATEERADEAGEHVAELAAHAAAAHAAPDAASTDEMAPPARRAEPEPGPHLRSSGLEEFERVSEGGGRMGTWLGVVLVLTAAALVAAYLLLGRDQSRAALGMAPGVEAQPESEAKAPAPKPEAPTHGTLSVDSSPSRAQVLLLVGEAPRRVDQLPVGVAQEFVALADGYAPARAVIPPEAEWNTDGAGAQYELAMQLEPLPEKQKRAEAMAANLGATRLPKSLGAPKGPLGSVRVITSPPGARVYQLIGFTPDVQVENLPVDEPLDLLLYLGGHAHSEVHVDRDDYAARDGALYAELDVKLERRR